MPARRRGRKRHSCSHCGLSLYNHRIFKIVATRYDINPLAFRSRIRTYHRPKLAFARQLAAYLLRQEGHRFAAIGYAICRSEDMAAYSWHRIDKLSRIDRRVSDLIDELAKMAAAVT